MNFFELDISSYAALPDLWSVITQRVGSELIHSSSAVTHNLPLSSNKAQLASAISFGLFHGILFSLPFSTSIFVTLRTFFCEGFQKGCFAFAGSLCGQLSFLYFTFFGWRPFIQVWYVLEPFLVVSGIILSLKLTSEFFHQKTFEQNDRFSDAPRGADAVSQPALFSWSRVNSLQRDARAFSVQNAVDSVRASWRVRVPKIFFFQFFLIFLNPVFPGAASRILLGQDNFDILGLGTDLQSSVVAGSVAAREMSNALWPCLYTLMYALSFIGICSLSLFLLYGFLCAVGTVYHRSSVLFSGSAPKTASLFEISKYPTQSSARDTHLLNKFFIFLIIGTVLQGSVLYSWRLFVQYPIEFFGTSEISDTPLGGGKAVIRREFPTMDSSIRHREKNLPMDRYLPVEKVNSRRILNGKPALSEEQKSDAYVKYNSFLLNQMDQSFENFKIRIRQLNSPVSTFKNVRDNVYPDRRSVYEEIIHLQTMKKRYFEANTGAKTTLTADSVAVPALSQHTITRRTEGLMSPLPFVENVASNVTKGKPKLGYVEELLTQDVNSLPSGSSYLHDDLQIYNSLFHVVGHGGTTESSVTGVDTRSVLH